MTNFRQLALIGSTASGKTALAIKVAQQYNAHILSLDSLAIYKGIDIVSAKPSLEERAGIKHYGIDRLYPDEHFDVQTFITLYQELYEVCMKEEKNLVIVGGTSFYLKMLLEGISTVPTLSQETYSEVSHKLLSLQESYAWLYSIDPTYMQRIATNDRYRIQKALEIVLETSLSPTEYFMQHPPISLMQDPLPIYQITWDRPLLRQRIAQRTEIMLKEGLIDEVCTLEKQYTRRPNCMKAIGIKETLAYLDGAYNKKVLQEKIATNTARLAKRQETFNNSQFNDVIKGSVEVLEKKLLGIS